MTKGRHQGDVICISDIASDRPVPRITDTHSLFRSVAGCIGLQRHFRSAFCTECRNLFTACRSLAGNTASPMARRQQNDIFVIKLRSLRAGSRDLSPRRSPGARPFGSRRWDATPARPIPPVLPPASHLPSAVGESDGEIEFEIMLLE